MQPCVGRTVAIAFASFDGFVASNWEGDDSMVGELSRGGGDGLYN